MEHQCLLTEQLMASTLARRIEGMKPEDAFPFILDWFKSVRHMAHANWISCNIQNQVSAIGVPLPDALLPDAPLQDGDEDGDEADLARQARRKAKVQQRLGKVNAFIREVYCITPNAQQLETIRKMME
jgi:hypothetical protein